MDGWHCDLTYLLTQGVALCVCCQLHWSDLKEETESTYSVHTLKDTTPLRTTGPFIYDAPYDVAAEPGDSSRHAPAADGTVPTSLDVSAPETQYWPVRGTAVWMTTSACSICRRQCSGDWRHSLSLDRTPPPQWASTIVVPNVRVETKIKMLKRVFFL